MTGPGWILNQQDRDRLQALLGSAERTPRRKLPRLDRPFRDALQPKPENSVGNDGPGGGDADGTGCPCTFIEVGTVDCLGTADSPTVFEIDDLGALGAAIPLTFDDACEWIGDDLMIDCYGSGGGSG